MENANKGSILVTGAAGFIGFHLSLKLLELGFEVFGFDNLNDYYDPKLKHERLRILKQSKRFLFKKGDISKKESFTRYFEICNPSIVVNLAAQAGVRYSFENPKAYLDSNIIGFFNVLECCRNHSVKHLVFASSSSVYGNQSKTPFSIKDRVDQPVSFYAATKKANEMMAFSYSHLYDIPMTGLRFFTVYGPYGRPDMAYFSFTQAIFNKKPIKVFNNGELFRDFTYVDDVVNGIISILDNPPKSINGEERFRIYNIGNNHPVKINNFIEILEKLIGEKAQRENLPMQKGDVFSTFADISEMKNDFGFEPRVDIHEGLARFVSWYKDFYKNRE